MAGREGDKVEMTSRGGHGSGGMAVEPTGAHRAGQKSDGR